MKNILKLLLVTSYLRLHVKSMANNKHISIYRFDDIITTILQWWCRNVPFAGE